MMAAAAADNLTAVESIQFLSLCSLLNLTLDLLQSPALESIFSLAPPHYLVARRFLHLVLAPLHFLVLRVLHLLLVPLHSLVLLILVPFHNLPLAAVSIRRSSGTPASG